MRQLVRTSCCLILFLFSLSSTAEPLHSETLFVYESTSSKTPATLIEYSSDGVWIIETFREDAEALPEKTGRWVFETKAQADQFMQSLSSVWLLQPLALQKEESRFKTEMMTQVLWSTENQWDWNWEIKFAAWVRANIDEKFFSSHKIATDCADVAIATRWIFARINKLPVGQTVGGNGRVLFTNESFKTEWQKLKRDADWSKDLVFRKALDYVLNHSFTHTLLRDSYPIAITPKAFLEGTYHLVTHTESGHTQLVMEVNASSSTRLPIYAVASTIPRAVRDLFKYPFFDSEQPELNKAGFLKMRWPQKLNGVWRLVAANQMPNYSLEQYDPDFIKDSPNFSLAVYKQLNPAFDPVLRVKESEMSFRQMVSDRIATVENGFAYCQTHDCSPGTTNYENWSTPSRDKRLGSFIADLESYVSDISNYFPDAKIEWDNFKQQKMLTLGKYDFLASSLILSWKLKLYNSDPTESVDVRWALSPEGFSGKIASVLRSNLRSREAILTSNSCIANSACDPTSALYKQFQTFETDALIRDLSSSVLSYCPNNTASACSDFDAAIANLKLNIGNEVVALANMPEFSVWLNSDPRHTSDIRRGVQALTHVTRVFDSEFLGVQESLNGFVLITTPKKVTLTDASLNSLWEIPQGSAETKFNPATGYFAIFENGQITVIEPNGTRAVTTDVLKLKESPTFRWTGPDILLVTTNDVPTAQVIYRLVVGSGKSSLVRVETVTSYDPSFADAFSDDRKEVLLTYYGKAANGQVTTQFYNLRTGLKHSFVVPSPTAVKNSVTAHLVFGSRVLISFQDSVSKHGELGWVRLTDGVFENWNVSFEALRILNDQTILVQSGDQSRPDTVEAFHLNMDGSIRLREKVGDTFSYSNIRKGYFSVLDNGREAVRHFEKDGHLSSFEIEDGRFMYAGVGPYIYLMNMGGQVDVYEQSTSKTLLSNVRFLGGDNIAFPFVLLIPNPNEKWLHYFRADTNGLPLLTSLLPNANTWVYVSTDENIGRFKSFVSSKTNTSVVFRAF